MPPRRWRDGASCGATVPDLISKAGRCPSSVTDRCGVSWQTSCERSAGIRLHSWTDTRGGAHSRWPRGSRSEWQARDEHRPMFTDLNRFIAALDAERELARIADPV